MTVQEADKKRWGGGYTTCPQYRLLKWKRRCEKYKNIKLLYGFLWMIYRKLQIKYGVDLPASTKIGPGFKIEHLNGIVVNPDVVIGKNCNIYNGVTIGKEKRGIREGCPTIADEGWIGANAIVVGRIQIGSDVLIAPGAYVNFDVPSHSIVLGNPAKIVAKENATEKYIKNTV